MSITNGRKAFGTDLKFTKEFTKIAEKICKDMPKYAKIR